MHLINASKPSYNAIRSPAVQESVYRSVVHQHACKSLLISPQRPMLNFTPSAFMGRRGSTEYGHIPCFEHQDGHSRLRYFPSEFTDTRVIAVIEVAIQGLEESSDRHQSWNDS